MNQNLSEHNINIKFNLFKPRAKNDIDILPSAPPYYE